MLVLCADLIDVAMNRTKFSKAWISDAASVVSSRASSFSLVGDRVATRAILNFCDRMLARWLDGMGPRL